MGNPRERLRINLYCLMSYEYSYKPRTRRHYRNNFYFKVRCGEFNTDQLFNNSGLSSNERSYTYKIFYDGKVFNGTFQGNVPQYFYEDKEQHGERPEVKNLVVSDFVLNITSADNPTPTSFQFKNLKLEKR